MAFVLASVAMAGALQAGPALASATSPMSEGTDPASGHRVLAGELEMAGNDDTSLINSLPASYAPDAFTEEEKELVCPKQYRVREIIYVGH